MKKIIMIIAMMSLAIFIAPRNVIADTFTIPPATRIEIGDPNMWDNPDVRIWGWSRDGKVAVSTEVFFPMPGISVRYVILNLVNDRTLFEIKEDVCESDDGCRHETAEELYRARRNEIMSAMSEHGIIEHHTPFAQFPFVAGDHTYTARVTTGAAVMVNDEEETRYSVIVSRNGRDKIIKRGSDWLTNHEVQGYYKSPFEERILVVIGSQRASHGVLWFFNGCHLTTGFD